jgi:hypothetical protein
MASKKQLHLWRREGRDTNSTNYLRNYGQTLSNIRERKSSEAATEDRKGKKKVDEAEEVRPEQKEKVTKSVWGPPNAGWHCLGVDASFIKESNSATWEALVRNHLGLIKWSAWGVLPECNSAEMAEALACLEGLK